MGLTSLYLTPSPSTVEAWFSFCAIQIENARRSNNSLLAMEIAYDWADYVSNKIDIKFQNNWKLFKKEIIKRYFGNYLGRKFKTGWSVDDVLTFLNQYDNIDFRISLFPTDIACHSISVALPFKDKVNWHYILSELNNKTDIEVFQQASSNNTICFRRFTTLFGEEIKYECGYGQAMDVFENEQGHHEIISVSKNNNCYKQKNIVPNSSELYNRLFSLIQSHDSYLHMKSKFLCRQLGIEWLSLEGYYNSSTNKKPLIVDIDLPFDYVFMKKKI
jgi:hypothetical protein